MNECQRSVLQRHFKQLANDLILSEDLMGDFYARKIFDRNMLSMIKVKLVIWLVSGKFRVSIRIMAM